MNRLFAVVLAAGKGTRMKSGLHKVLHPICGKPMAEHLIETLETVGVTRTIFVVGHDAERIRQHFGSRIEYCFQQEQLGTGHAVMQAESILGGMDGITLVINGDTPLVTSQTIAGMMEYHRTRSASATLLTTVIPNPTGYGRIVRADDQTVLKIVEEKDASPEEKEIQEVNVGFYLFDNRVLFRGLKKISNRNLQGEYYLTDIVDVLRRDGERILAYQAEDAEETISINDRVALAEAERILRRRINEKHMRNGVTIQDPERTYIGPDVLIGRDTTILSGCHLNGKTVIGENCVIGPDTDITDSTIADKVTIMRSVVIESSVEPEAHIGPFAYLRPNSRVGKGVKIGDFVEIKNSVLGEGTKISHLSYVGDAEIGREVNIGCGAVTVNYDGVAKHKTVVGDHAFIGCNVNLVAPVKVGENAYIAAGSTITQDVPDHALAIARERQTNKENYTVKLKAKRKPYTGV